MKQLRAAVIGTGHLGYYHAQKYSLLPDVELVAIVDKDKERASYVADDLGTQAYQDYKDVLEQVDLVSIAVPTRFYYEVASHCLSAGKHVLVEKPITQSVQEAQRLIDLAKDNKVVLQVGHSERFHPALRALGDELQGLTFIEGHRLAPFKIRGTDVDVIMDLMIHDIDIILTLIDSPLVNVQPAGASVVTDQIDIANARLEFDNGCVANITSSRVSDKSMRKMRFFRQDEYISIDFSYHKITRTVHNPEADIDQGDSLFIVNDEHFKDSDVILEEISQFLQSISTGAQVSVSGEEGKRALEIALEIGDALSHKCSKK